VGVGGHEDLVARDLGADNLHDDVLVGEAHYQAVLGRIVLVLGLVDEALAGIVVGLAGASALVLGLVAAAESVSLSLDLALLLKTSTSCHGINHVPKVSAVLDQLVERLSKYPESAICASDLLVFLLSEATCGDSKPTSNYANWHFCHCI
jgi:hypothetical protein